MMSLFGSSGVAMLQRTQQGLLWARNHECTAPTPGRIAADKLSSSSGSHLVTHPVWPSRVPCGAQREGILLKWRHAVRLDSYVLRHAITVMRRGRHTATMHIGRPCNMSLGRHQANEIGKRRTRRLSCSAMVICCVLRWYRGVHCCAMGSEAV